MNARKILIVEDEQLVAFDLCSLLERNGYSVLGAARSAKEAMELIRNQSNVDLMIVDFKIQGPLNGEQAAGAIRSYFKEAIPVIFVSASPITEIQERLPSDPCSFITKPFNHDWLIQCIEEAFAHPRPATAATGDRLMLNRIRDLEKY